MSHSRTKTSAKPSRDGITLFEGDVSEFGGKVTVPGGLEIAQYEGLVLCWDYEETEKENCPSREVRPGGQRSRFADSFDRARGTNHPQPSGKGGWGFYDLHVEENDDRAAVNVSFI